MLAGIVVMGVGLYLLTRLGYGSSTTDLTIAMVVLGVGLGLTMQQYTLVVQNSAERRDLGVATASTQFFRNVGSTVGIALCGTVMTSGMQSIAKYLPPDAVKSGGLQHLDAGAVLDPKVLGQLPPAIQAAVRHGLGDQIHNIFLVMLPMVVLIFLATMFIKAVPLRDHTMSAERSGEELLDSLGSSDADAPADDSDARDADEVDGSDRAGTDGPRRALVSSDVG